MLILFFIILLFLFLHFFGVLCLRCHAWAFSSCSEGGYSLVAVHGLLIEVASLVELGLQGGQASIVLVRGVSCSAACGISLEQG